MKNSIHSSLSFLSLLVAATHSAVIQDRDATATTRACQLIKQALPQQVFFPGPHKLALFLGRTLIHETQVPQGLKLTFVTSKRAALRIQRAVLNQHHPMT